LHMADALVSTAVGGTMWAVSAGLMAWCARRVKEARDDRLIPMMGVLGAFIFTAQMLNFTIPVTGSSGHLGGGLILAILLGPHAAFLVIASVLTVQALFFADGGLLALGCNMFNLGFAPAFIATPFLYKPLAGQDRLGTRAWIAAVVAAVVGLQLGAFGVVVETVSSGITDLPFGKFALVMQPIHLAIGIVEGLVTAAVVAVVARARPESFALPLPLRERAGVRGLVPLLLGFLVAAVLLGGIVSWFASSHPDGLEWSITKVTGKEEIEEGAGGLHAQVAAVQEKTALLPDYGFKTDNPDAVSSSKQRMGTSLSGLLGGGLSLAIALLIGLALKPMSRPSERDIVETP
jgi:cobalt/nickel transport system permease protein